jgi:hypothetical protein
MGYKVTCKELDQGNAYIIFHNCNKVWIHELLYRDISSKCQCGQALWIDLLRRIQKRSYFVFLWFLYMFLWIWEVGANSWDLKEFRNRKGNKSGHGLNQTSRPATTGLCSLPRPLPGLTLGSDSSPVAQPDMNLARPRHVGCGGGPAALELRVMG